MNRLLLVFLLLSQLVQAQTGDQVKLETLIPVLQKSDANELKINKSIGGNTLNINGTNHYDGIGVEANSEITYELNRDFKTFSGTIGLDNEIKKFGEKTGLYFLIYGDGKKLFESEKLTLESQAVNFQVSVEGVSILKLVVNHAAEKMHHPHADWVNLLLTRVSEKVKENSVSPTYLVKCKSMELGLSEDGQISKIRLGKNKANIPFLGKTNLSLCTKTGVIAKKLRKGGIEFLYRLKQDETGDECRVKECYYPTENSIRWELEITGINKAWTCPISSFFSWPVSSETRIWLPWGNPDGKAIQAEWGMEFKWQDPLVPVPFYNQTFNFGMPDYPEGNRGYVAYDGNNVSLPMITILEPSRNQAVSIICSPEDAILFQNIDVTKLGDIRFSRYYNRICSDKTIRFAADVVMHEADWRGGLRWMVNRYPNYFNPALPLADEIAGCGSYSSYEGPLEASRFQKMGYRLNWKASFDFPYMGMFIPPVKSPAEKWTRFNADSDGNWNGKSEQTSVEQLCKYGKQMRSMGFYVLDYFNMTELGYELRGINAPDPKTLTDDELWKNPKAFIQKNLNEAVIMTNWKGYPFLGGNPLFTWGDAVIVDPGTPCYQQFLIGQADRLIANMKFSSGVCIDRTDHTRAFNQRSDDGITLWHGKPARALVNSWKETLTKVAGKFHQAGKVVYVNDHNHRIDLMKDVDGFYDEAGHLGTSLNNTSFLALRKPAIAWTASSKTLGTHPDNYFQTLLYMGVFPTAPVTGNDHTIVPDAVTDSYYLQYGPLLNTLRGRKWVLEPHVVEVEKKAAKVNLFKVPDGFVMPVVFVQSKQPVKVKIRKSARTSNLFSAFMLSPDSKQEMPIKIISVKDYFALTVPAGKRGAMVKLKARK